MKKKTADITPEDIRKQFHKIYYSDIAPQMIEYEKRRKKEIFKLVLIELVLIFAATGLIYYYMQTGVFWMLILFILSILSIILAPIIRNISFTQMLKSQCMRKIVHAMGNIKWESGGNIISTNKLQKSNLFMTFNNRSSDDTFEGFYKGVNYSIEEAYLWFKSGSGRNSVYYDVFKGVIINFIANKDIENTTIVATKGDKDIKNRNPLVWIIGIAVILQIYIETGIFPGTLALILAIIAIVIMSICRLNSKDEHVLNKIILEDAVFNKKYTAYSGDEINGRYLLTTAFMERFNNVKTAFGVEKIKCSFYDKYLMIAISTKKNLFEIGNLYTPLNSPKQLETFFNEFISILKLIDYFKLDEKTGL